MATIPYKRGMELSAIGIQARSEMSRVITNSYGCISPICRFPIKRITINNAINTIVVRIKISPIALLCEKFLKNIRKIFSKCLHFANKGDIMIVE